MLPSPDQNVKIGSVGRFFFFFFFFFLRTVRELSFPIFFLKFLNGENSAGMQSKRIYTSAFLSHWIQIWANSSPKSDIFKTKKNPTLFFRILRSVGRGQHNLKKKFWPNHSEHSFFHTFNILNVSLVYIQWNLIIPRSDITKSSYNEVILLVLALYISLFFYPDIMRNLI